MPKKISPEEYQKMVQRKMPASKLWTNCVKAFLIGGLICTIGQAFSDLYKSVGLSEDLSGTATSITMIFLGILLTGLDIYPKIAKHAGAGTVVPITGFANAVSAPAIESRTEGLVLGVGAKLFSIAGPVILYGTVASVIAGLIFFLFKI